MAYNWCWWLRNYFDVVVLYCSGDYERLKKMSHLVKMEKYQEGKVYECDIFIRNSVWGLIPQNIKAKRMIEMRHANYKYLLEKGWLYQQYKDMGIKEIVGCGEFVSKMSHEALGDNPTTIKNILLPRKETQKVLKLISCTRLDGQKGWNRMLKMCDMMKNAGIKFEWNIFTNAPQKCQYEEIHFWKQRYDIWDYLADADYTVLLSDSEGLPYTVQESLQYQVPCIVTNVGGCIELIKDGINGYVIPLDMNFDINKIKKIPKCPEYDNHALEDWLKYLEYDGEIIDEKVLIEKFKKEEEKMSEKNVKVKSLIKFTDMTENVERVKDDVFMCTQERANYLVAHNAVEILEVIKDEIPNINNENVDEALERIHESAQEEVKKTVNKKSSKKKEKSSYRPYNTIIKSKK